MLKNIANFADDSWDSIEYGWQRLPEWAQNMMYVMLVAAVLKIAANYMERNPNASLFSAIVSVLSFIPLTMVGGVVDLIQKTGVELPLFDAIDTSYPDIDMDGKGEGPVDELQGVARNVLDLFA